MNIIDHTRRSKKPKRHCGRNALRVVLVIGLAYVCIGSVRYIRPLPDYMYKTTVVPPSVSTAAVTWPSAGQSAIGDTHSGVLLSSPNQTPRPTASVIKVMTALAVLRKKPLTTGQQGPEISLTQTDVTIYEDYVSRDGSVVAVRDGEKITEYQALQALMLPSANNIADSLVNWAFGDMESYTKYATIVATSLGMTQTTITDASGFSSETVSTPHDLILLGKAALAEPVLAEIVSQSTAQIPVQGQIRNVNSLLGEDGINGIKTGNTDEAGGCFLVSATRILPDGKPHTFIVATMGFPTRGQAMTSSVPLLAATQQNYDFRVLAKKNQIVGSYSSDWGEKVDAVIGEDLKIFGWNGSEFSSKVSLQSINNDHSRTNSVGTVQSNNGTASVNVYLSKKLTGPSRTWRLQKAFTLW